MDIEESAQTYAELLQKTLPEVFAADAPHHNCVYRNLALKFVREDVRLQSMKRLEGTLSMLINLFHSLKIFRLHIGSRRNFDQLGRVA
jgi:hypothetical protein